MLPTIQQGDSIHVEKTRPPYARGAIVLFKPPPSEADPNIRYLDKRVIGLPGETVEGRDGTVFVNGRALSEPYLNPGSPMQDFGASTVPADSYWVMGDNRGNSKDSRQFGPIPSSLMVGVVASATSPGSSKRSLSARPSLSPASSPTSSAPPLSPSPQR